MTTVTTYTAIAIWKKLHPLEKFFDEPLGGGMGESESQDQLDPKKGEQYQNESVWKIYRNWASQRAEVRAK